LLHWLTEWSTFQEIFNVANHRLQFIQIEVTVKKFL
jgi:hypothetical protein